MLERISWLGMAMIDAADLYNQLPLLAEVRVESSALTRAQQAASEVIRSNRATDYAAISLVHRHFELDSGIAPVWRVEDSEMRLRPAAYDGAKLVPVTWKRGINGEPTPIEFTFERLLPEHLRHAIQSGQFGHLSGQIFARLSVVDQSGQFGLTVTPSVFSEFFFSEATSGVVEPSFQEVLGMGGEFTKIIPSGLNAGTSKDVVDTVWWIRGGKMRVAVRCHCAI